MKGGQKYLFWDLGCSKHELSGSSFFVFCYDLLEVDFTHILQGNFTGLSSNFIITFCHLFSNTISGPSLAKFTEGNPEPSCVMPGAKWVFWGKFLIFVGCIHLLPRREQGRRDPEKILSKKKILGSLYFFHNWRLNDEIFHRILSYIDDQVRSCIYLDLHAKG